MSAPVDDTPTAPIRERRAWLPRLIRIFALPIIVGWVVIIGLLNTTVPQLEVVGKQRAVSMSPQDAPSMIAMKRIGTTFEEYDTSSSVMIVLEGEDKLGVEALEFYLQMVADLRADTEHVQYVQDLWSDSFTAAGAQSVDGKSAYTQVYISGDQGETLANESVRAVRDIVVKHPRPEGVEVYVTGSAATTTDQNVVGDESMRTIEMLTFGVIIILLLLIYRSVTTTLVLLSMLAMGLLGARGLISFLGYHGAFGLTTFATNMVVTLTIATAVDYGIFLVGRYQEARRSGKDRESAYYEMFHGTAHVVAASGLTIAGATFCLNFTRLPYFESMGTPMAIAMVFGITVALTYGPAIISVASRFGKILEPKKAQGQGWRRVGTSTVRWPGAFLVVALAACMVGLLALPSYHTTYNDRLYLPDDISANIGYAAATRHFSEARMNPDVLMVETDRDLRNPAGFLMIDKIAKALSRVEGVAQVQAITRPDGKPIEHTTIPYMIGQQGVGQLMANDYQQGVIDNILAQADEMQHTIDSMERMNSITRDLSVVARNMADKMSDTSLTLQDVRDSLADFDDFFRPMRNYFYWEPHCFNIPVCWSMRSIFESLDGMSTMSDDFQDMVPDIDRMADLTLEMTAVMPGMIQSMKNQKQMMLNQYQVQRAQQDQTIDQQEDSAAMGEAFDEALNDDSFYVPPEAFDNADFKRGMELMMSPDGHAVRFTIIHQGDPMTEEGISRMEPLKKAAAAAIKGTPLEGSLVYLGGAAAMFDDMQEGADYDLLIAVTAALLLILVIMMIITRALVASLVIVGTVTLSLGTAFGVSVVLWQHIIGIPLHWMVLPLSVIILVAVGADYNLLLVSRMKEEIHAGLRTGTIRAMAGTGPVVTAAGLVFALTMATMAVSDLIVIGQVGTTIGIGLMFDTFVIRGLMTPSVATLLGRWFWWPLAVRQRPRPSPWPKPIQRDPEDALN
ncbi:membrane protein [Mycolicibacterium chitae]|uniref:Transmembrane transport protein MmpL1 n=1 Tax=Mycolicibacterium chitae TaxID=1792 RepID=A0A3S4RJQ2_MYCCI|nr:MMPL family transporter [Mycolicibacterium chitae]MCV7109277.1 MMPL family transporter [Mycolicibacterium chitae]BBZ00940.1 membrane protein [Mycolicibacterium chitae]VEG49787.1 transmembrane transport protein MmpL1 [Mycolicibacterium chitae]